MNYSLNRKSVLDHSGQKPVQPAAWPETRRHKLHPAVFACAFKSRPAIIFAVISGFY